MPKPSNAFQYYFTAVDGIDLVTRGLAYGYNGSTSTAATVLYITGMGLVTNGLVYSEADFWHYTSSCVDATWICVDPSVCEPNEYATGGTLFVVAPGFSNAYRVTREAYEVASALRWFSGGSLEIMQASTQSPVQTGAGQGYLLSQFEQIAVDGAVSYYLCATGATASAYCLREFHIPIGAGWTLVE